MANFNEKINSHKGLFLLDQCSEYFIERVGSMWMFKQKIDDDLHCRKIAYRLFIQYKTTHRVKKVAGRCFLWDNSHGDHIADPGNGVELRNMKDASQDNCEGFGNPRFDGMESAILITDRYVFMYGDVQIEAFDITQDKKHVICTASLCGSLVSSFGIPAEVFDRHFGLKENFPEQCAKPVQEENDLVEKAKRNVELCKNLLYSTKQMIERAVDLMQCAIIEIEDRSDQAVELIQGALIDIDGRKRELDNILTKLDDTLRKSK